MGITALISTLLGFVGGAVPDLLAEFRAARQHQRELETMARQAELQRQTAEIEGATRRAEAEASVAVAELTATKEQLLAAIQAQRDTGIRWVDGLNQVLRPVAVVLILLLFMATSGAFVACVITQYAQGTIGAGEMSQIIWASPVGFAIEAILAFLFGMRSAMKKRGS